MLIHGKQLTITNDGCAIYYDHIKIMDKDGSIKLNEWTDWDYWVNIISNNPNFDPKIYHPTLQK